MAHVRKHNRLRVSTPNATVLADAWGFLSPWIEQLHERLKVHPDGYLQVLRPNSQLKRPERFDTSHWRTREAMELLVLVHAVNNRAWAQILREKCALRFAEEEGLLDANNDDEGDNRRRRSGVTPKKQLFKFECERDREIPLSPQFFFGFGVGSQQPGELSPVETWRHFFLSHTSEDYEPSPEFLEAKQQVLMMQDEKFKKHPRVPQCVEIPIALKVGMSRDVSTEFVAHMRELRDLIEAMKGRAAAATAAGEANDLSECARMFTYRLDSLSLDIYGVAMTEACMESVLDVLRTGIPIAGLEVNLRNGIGAAGNGKIRSIGTFDFVGEYDSVWNYEALYATLAVARTPVANLCAHEHFIRHGDEFKLLAKSLFSPRSTSYPTIHGLDISYVTADLETIVNVVKDNDNDSGIEWQLHEGTPLLFADVQANHGAVVTKQVIPIPVVTNRGPLSVDTSDKRGLVEVVLPGYGKCQAPRDALAPRKGLGLNGSACEAEPVSSLSLWFSDGNNALGKLLSQIGRPLRSLSLQYFDTVDDEEMMTAILQSCPKLTNLSLFPCNIDLNRLVTNSENFSGEPKPRISSLSLIRVRDIGADHGVAFAKLLGNPRSRLAQHLEELTIMTAEESELTIMTAEESTAVNGSTLRALWMALKKNTKLKRLELIVQPRTLKPWKNRFRQFHGQVLPPVRVDLPAKLALLSAICGTDNNGDKVLSAVQQLDQRAVSLVFEFAATRAIRSVIMFYRF